MEFEFLAPCDDVSTGDDAEVVEIFDVNKRHEAADVGAVSATSVGVDDVGEPLDDGGDFGELVELFAR